jgi:hypothetical protein
MDIDSSRNMGFFIPIDDADHWDYFLRFRLTELAAIRPTSKSRI